MPFRPNENPAIGTAAERLFKNSVGRHPEVLTAIKTHFNVGGNFARSYMTGTDAGKSDVIVAFDDQTRISANVKAFSAGFNQLTRTTIASFCTEFALGALRPTLEAGAIRKAGRTGKFIADGERALVLAAFGPIARRIVHYSLANLENPELLVLYDRGPNRMHIYDLADVLANLDYTTTISARGTIKIGEYVTVQRKGGNGVRFNHIAKTSLAHPGNNLQVKMKVKAFVQNVEPIISYSP
jgi:hypothetical protein